MPTTASDRYKWTALSNTTLGVFMAMLDSSIVIISLPAIFRGIHLNPLLPSNIGYLLWMLMGYLVVTAVLVVTFGRIGDIFGRVRMYNLGFAIFTGASIALSLTPLTGTAGAMWLIIWQVVQGIDPEGSHANWMENFPWTRLEGVELPEAKPLVPAAELRALGPAGVRELLGDGSYGGRYQRPDGEMLELWRTGVEETRELLEQGWR